QATVIIALTASAFEEDRTMVLSAGCDDFVRKPFREADLFEVMAKHVDIRYEYAEVPETAMRPESAGGENHMVEALHKRPSDWLSALQAAAMQADSETLQALITQIEPEQAALARQLTHLVDHFMFDRITDLTRWHSADEMSST
ncbi:MAG: hypothetical protein ACE5G0_16100, partial [Rhodothermales bacterium]